MKKYFAFLLCFIIIFSFVSCDTENEIKDTENEIKDTENEIKDTENDTVDTEASNKDDGTKDSESTDKPITEAKQYYKIENLELTKVRYYIYDSDGNTVLSDETDRPLDISMLGDNIVDICIEMETGVSIHKYYDVQNNIFSEEYSCVAVASGNLVAYVEENSLNDRILVVRDIFNKNAFYKSFGLDFSPTVTYPIVSATFTDGEAELKLVYLRERPPVPFSVTIPIRRASNEGEILSEAQMAMLEYYSALKNEIKVYETDTEEWNYLKDCKTPYNGTPLCEFESLSYNYIDVDGDLINELVIDCGDILILRYYEGAVYVYSFTFRNMYYLNTDGSYSWNCTGEKFEYGEKQIYFEGAELKTRDLYRIVNDGEPNAEYYIDGKQVTQEEFFKYIEDNPKTKLDFSPLEVSWQNKISYTEAIELAREYWECFDIEENGYRVERAVNSRAPSSVYVFVIRQLVLENHYSAFDEIWIDKNTGATIIPYWSDGKG